MRISPKLMRTMFGVALVAGGASPVHAEAPGRPGSVETDESTVAAVNLERRALASDSSLRKALENKLGPGKMAETFQIEVSYLASMAPESFSAIDTLELAYGGSPGKSAYPKDYDPFFDPDEPNGPGSRPGQTATVQALCKQLRVNGNPQFGNVNFNWVWTPNVDSNGDGKRDGKDRCPCSWVLSSINIEYHVEGNPLDC